MNAWTICGIVVVGFGTLMMLWGQLAQSKADSKSLEKKIEEVKETIAKAKTGSGDQGISKIQSEFDKWAEDFIRTKDQQRVTFQRERLAKQDNDLRLSAIARPIYQDVVVTFRGAIGAYNSKSKRRIECELPDLPNNLFAKYSGWIEFGKDKYWFIELLETSPHDQKDPPGLWVSLGRGKTSGPSMQYVNIAVSADASTVGFSEHGNDVLVIPEMKDTLKLTSDRSNLRSIMTKWLGAQIVATEE